MSRKHEDEAGVRGRSGGVARVIRDAQADLLAKLNESRPHAAADNEEIMLAIDTLIVARIMYALTGKP